MPALTQFVDGSGPVWSGNLFPFLFITIACGAVSGFHALISSGTTPKLIENETQARYIGYGGMLMESFVAIMALVAACVIEPGIYYAMNSPAAVIGTTPDQVAQVVSSWGFVITPADRCRPPGRGREHHHLARGGALAVGMAHILHQAIGGPSMMAFWYHFAILFEALFILTAVDAGTRAGRFMLQDLMGTFAPSLKRTESLPANLIATGLCVAAWGYFLYQGVVDPLGGINTLWPLFGIANQMLAAIALTLGAVVLFKMKRERYAWVAVLPTLWLLACTLTAGWQKIFAADPKVSFGARRQVQRRHRRRQGAGPGQVAGADVARGAERLHQRRSVRDLHVRGDQHGDFRHPGARRAENRPTSRETPYERCPAPRRPARTEPDGGRMLFSNMTSAAGAAGRYLGQTLRLMVGVPDYETYVEHMRATHPDQEPMSYEAFFRERQDARYGGKKRIGCC